MRLFDVAFPKPTYVSQPLCANRRFVAANIVVVILPLALTVSYTTITLDKSPAFGQYNAPNRLLSTCQERCRANFRGLSMVAYFSEAGVKGEEHNQFN